MIGTLIFLLNYKQAKLSVYPSTVCTRLLAFLMSGLQMCAKSKKLKCKTKKTKSNNSPREPQWTLCLGPQFFFLFNFILLTEKRISCFTETLME